MRFPKATTHTCKSPRREGGAEKKKTQRCTAVHACFRSAPSICGPFANPDRPPIYHIGWDLPQGIFLFF